MTDKVGIFDPKGINLNPLTGEPYSDDYKKLAVFWSSLPAYEKAENIYQDIKENNIVFIISDTGSGKTVIVPKLALHYSNYKGVVGVTLPKRIITLSAATFAAKTLDVKLGTHVGYIYKGADRKMQSSENKIVYMTDGSLIMQFVKDPLLSKYSAIIIDEAHERSVQIDILLLFLKIVLESGMRPDLRVIIMSATIDGPKYQKYFKGVKSKIVNLSGRTNHEITTYFLDKPSPSYMSDGIQLIEKLIKDGAHRDMLFFITTSSEAVQLCNIIRPKYPKIFCIEVYSDMDSSLKIYAEDSEKFTELGDYNQKLIMATNVAESSITIDGLKYVIDSGYELFSFFDPGTIGQVLEKRFISQAQALQRRGRVGRTEPGFCYNLYTEEQFEEMSPYREPEILKQDITIDMLKIIQRTDSKTYQEGYEIMQQLMDPPKKSYVDLSTQLYILYKIIDNDKLTQIGQDILQFSSLPLNQSLFLIYSYQLFAAKEASIILGMIDALKGKITNLFFKKDNLCGTSCQKNLEMIKGMTKKKGDHLTFLNLYNIFQKESDQKAWARKYNIKMDVFNRANRAYNDYYRKIVNISKIPRLSRAENMSQSKKIVQALKLSHKHLTAKNLTPVFAAKKIHGQISRDSVVNLHYKRNVLDSKTFVYNELTSINRNWEYSVITLI